MSTSEAVVSEPRERLLRVASELFYAKGIHAVGVEEIVSSAHVTRATLYRHFEGKDALVAAYLHAADRSIRSTVESIIAAEPGPEARVRGVGAMVQGQIRSEGFRGCAFLNAAAEFPDDDNPVHRAVLEHRDWFQTTMAELFAETDVANPGPAARHFVMLRDGAMAAGCLTDPEGVCAVFERGVEGLLAARGPAPAG
ncbi:TetR/AcrR family transcriptional regulator [Phycicoccus endophyticus]|uniref:TetR/AcrR family transcriptional regulator n=1 Tax=Phycicoccus endophyticus TaxID=1690220 RepID=A0A7G9R1S6_9MICO|nr:TetR/AcrR family transcriptional regulator [Phycicoccus endophyticus]NHI18651.1 TetR/AcrR family transcriptional regulator [Phycicoccus endophyticus]QNN49551.1 TetR/AcrR family transcriptional regulator [Phycicoccus endophyticus]GGL37496.1 TetR family transcriptional regulator [Phycicoccus endophyticus]